MKAIYRFHPGYLDSTIWWGDPERRWGQATLEGGDIMPVGNRTVLLGMSERTSRQANTHLAERLFTAGSVERVVVAGIPKLRSTMHLDSVFTFADRDLVTCYPSIVDGIRTFSLHPGDNGSIEVADERKLFISVVANALGLKRPRTITPCGDGQAGGTTAMGLRQ